jgi:hypothetical protein
LMLVFWSVRGVCSLQLGGRIVAWCGEVSFGRRIAEHMHSGLAEARRMSDAGKEDGVAGWMRGASIGLKVR